MRRLCQFLVLLVFAISFASATDITYTIIGEKVLVEIMTDGNEVITLPDIYSTLESNKEYNLHNNKLITEKANIKFITKNYIKKTKDEYLFILPRPTVTNPNIEIYLPENYILSDSLVFPKNYNLSTNGKNIILEWKSFDESEIIIFYQGAHNSNLFYFILFGVLLIAIAVVFYFQQKKFKKKIKLIKKKQYEAKQKIKKMSITKNLFGDEKKIIEYLLSKNGKSSWTKEMGRKLGISKVRLSRKLRSLSEKNLIKKEIYGNENRISLE